MEAAWPNPDRRKKLERQTAALARAMLSGEQTVVAGTQRMVRLLMWLGVPREDRDFTPFVAVASETNHLPIGEERQYWDPAALRVKDQEIARIERWAASFTREACERLVLRFARERSAPPGHPEA